METIRRYADTANEKSKPDAEEKKIQARINANEVKQAAMNREVERLRELRKKTETMRVEESKKREKEEEYRRGLQRLKNEQARRNEELKKKREDENKQVEEEMRRYIFKSKTLSDVIG